MGNKEGHVRGREDQETGAERSREQGLLLLVHRWAWGPNSGLYTTVCEQGAGAGNRAFTNLKYVWKEQEDTKSLLLQSQL